VFDNFFLFASSETGVDLGGELLKYAEKNQSKSHPDGRYLLIEAGKDRQGLLETAAWNLMRYQKTDAPKPPADELEEQIPF
jgi:hypothetical protein